MLAVKNQTHLGPKETTTKPIKSNTFGLYQTAYKRLVLLIKSVSAQQHYDVWDHASNAVVSCERLCIVVVVVVHMDRSAATFTHCTTPNYSSSGRYTKIVILFYRRFFILTKEVPAADRFVGCHWTASFATSWHQRSISSGELHCTYVLVLYCILLK